MTLIIPRLELWTDLACVSGATRLSTGGIISQWTQGQLVTSEEGEESLTYTIPLTAEAASIVREGYVTRVWWSSSRYEEWPIRRVEKRRSGSGVVDVKCGPVSYRLAEHGWIQEWQVSPQDGLPIFDIGLVKTTVSQVLTTYLVNNTYFTAVVPWVAIGSIPSEIASVQFDINWSMLSAQALVNAVVDAAQSALGKPYIWRLVRNGTTSYDITLYAATV